MPRRTSASTKFSSGNVFIIGGSHGLTGAPSMAALAAMRAGGGYVQVAVPESLEGTFELRLMEAMTRAMPEKKGSHVPSGAEHVRELSDRRSTAVVLGP